MHSARPIPGCSTTCADQRHTGPTRSTAYSRCTELLCMVALRADIRNRETKSTLIAYCEAPEGTASTAFENSEHLERISQ